MKKLFLFLLCFSVTMSLCACGGDVGNVKTRIGESSLYTEGEIKAAMGVVKSHFSREFENCVLTDLWYDEDPAEAEEWADQYHAKEAIILYSNFEAGPAAGDGSLNPNSTYSNWKWILVRNSGSWQLKTWGYG